MIFCTAWFLAFSLIAGVLYLGVRRWPLARLGLMLAASLVFYFHFAGLAGFLVISGLALFTYYAGLWLHRSSYVASHRRSRLIFCLTPAALALLYFRYYEFILESVAELADRVGWADIAAAPWATALQPVLVPLGISFFAFEFCHYLIDVHHRGAPIRNPLHFAIFALFYPRLASGPIIRYQQIIPQLERLPVANLDDVSQGLIRISIGFAKKFVLADPAAHLIETSFQASNILAVSDVWWLCLLLYVRIYMDFSGYCDMALGLARLWGIRLPENFSFPFLATSPSAFWRRWHITLSTWIRDYIYIPLGGGRVPAWRKGLNLLLAMSLCGLWHGSAWNFVLWGALHGLALQVGHGLGALATFAREKSHAPAWLRPIGHYAGLALGWSLTQVFVALTWVLFFYSIEDAAHILGKLNLLP